MARTADHDARRAQVVAGVTSLALEQGLGRVTVAGAARSAGVSVGLVQHYYASKEELLLATYSSVRTGVLARVDRATGRAERRGARIEQMMADGLVQLLPLDRRRREEAYLSHAFAGLAMEDAQLRDHLARADDELTTRVATALENGKKCGEVEPTTPSTPRAHALVALTGGLAARLLTSTDAHRRRWAVEAVAGAVAEVCPGRCNHRPTPTD